jgi:hypothetical protein
VDGLASRLAIATPIAVVVVQANPLVVSVEPAGAWGQLIALRVVTREHLERYTKLWARSGAKGDLEKFLGR